MKRVYSCTRCNAVLNPNVKILLRASRQGHKGLILLSPQPGNYKAIVSDDLELSGGDLVEFACPVCGETLTSQHDKNLAAINFKFTTGLQGTVFFSRRFGEHATYFVADDDVKVYGENANQSSGMNFFGAGRLEE